MEQKQSGWTAARIVLMVTVLAVFAGGLYMLADFFASEGHEPAGIRIPPPPPPPADAMPAR